jgi:hypothetical protein
MDGVVTNHPDSGDVEIKSGRLRNSREKRMAHKPMSLAMSAAKLRGVTLSGYKLPVQGKTSGAKATRPAAKKKK